MHCGSEQHLAVLICTACADQECCNATSLGYAIKGAWAHCARFGNNATKNPLRKLAEASSASLNGRTEATCLS